MKMKMCFALLFAVASTLMSQAALVAWTVDCYEFSSDVSGYTLYMLTSDDGASAYATALSGKTYKDASEFTSAIGAAAGTLDGDAYAEGTASGVSDYVSALIIADTAEGSQIYYTDGLDLTGHTYNPGEPQGLLLEIWDTDFKNGGVIAYGTGGGGIPEPTSGLLLLIGGSLLALRRKHK